VHAYVIDQGLYAAHSEFGSRASVGYDGIGTTCTTADDAGHATHVGGTIGGTTYGVAKGVTLVGVRVLDCSGSGSVSGVIAGIDWVTANAVKPAVANMSLGGGASTALDDAVGRSISAGVVYAIAAGNGDIFGRAQDACTTSPARVAAAITVSATNSSDTKASWANYGSCVDLFAPGVSITSAWVGSPTATNTISGTSMATPHVAGAVALYLETHPLATPADVAAAIASNATPNKVVSAGTGSPNRLLFTGASVLPPPPTTDAPPTARFTYSCSGFTCSFDGRSSSDDNGISSFAWTFSGGSPASAATATASSTFQRRTSPVVTLTVTDGAGQRSSATATLSCNQRRCQ
jgi:subtilisin family serine protease